MIGAPVRLNEGNRSAPRRRPLACCHLAQRHTLSGFTPILKSSPQRLREVHNDKVRGQALSQTLPLLERRRYHHLETARFETLRQGAPQKALFGDQYAPHVLECSGVYIGVSVRLVSGAALFSGAPVATQQRMRDGCFCYLTAPLPDRPVT